MTPQAEVLNYLYKIHRAFPDSLESARPKILERPDSKYTWELTELPTEFLRSARWRELWHHHRGFELMNPKETLDDALTRWPSLPHRSECARKIFSLQKLAAQTPPEPLILGLESNGQLEHIDGFHRLIAGLLTGQVAFTVYLAKPKA